MAQHFYGPAQVPIGLHTTPANSFRCPTPVSHSPSSRSQPSNLGIKEESYDIQPDNQEVGASTTGPPSKRQKTRDGVNNHKFVAQKKWKFQDGQQWLPSKVSTKAQNASKAIIRGKTESVSPEQPLSPVSAPSSYAVATSVAYAQSPRTPQHTEQRPTVESRMFASAEDLERSRSSILQGISSRQQGNISKSSLPTRRPKTIHEASIAAEPLQTKDLIDDTSSPQLGLGGSGTLPRASLERARVPRKSSPLSFERDKERIAAIIAEKREENEFNLFRQRLLQRQQQHKSHRGASIDVDESLPTMLASATQSPSETRAPSRDPDAGSPYRTVSISSLPEERRPSRSPTKVTQTFVTNVAPQLQKQSRKARDDSKLVKGTTVSEGFFATTSNIARAPAPTSNDHRVDQHDRKNLFGAASRPEPQPRAQQPLRTQANSNNVSSYRPRNGSAPFEVEDADLAAQFTAFTRQLVPSESNQNTQSGQTPANHNAAPHHYRSQLVNQSPLVHSQSMTGASSQTSSTRFQPNDPTLNLVPPQASPSFAHSPTSRSIQQFSHIDLSSSQSHQSAMLYGTNSSGTRSASTGHMPVYAGPYGTNSHSWNPHGQHIISNSTTSHGGPLPSGTGLNNGHAMTNPAAMAQPGQRRPSQPTVAPANTNMFNGTVRTHVDNSESTALPKTRVNMFSNTRGVPFPVDEVIRQIEMI